MGHSRGLITPFALLEACELSDAVDLRIDGKTLVIEAIKAPRSCWFDDSRGHDAMDALASLPLDEEGSEWEW